MKSKLKRARGRGLALFVSVMVAAVVLPAMPAQAAIVKTLTWTSGPVEVQDYKMRFFATENLSDPSTGVSLTIMFTRGSGGATQQHNYSFQLPASAMSANRTLSSGSLDTGTAMGEWGRINLDFTKRDDLRSVKRECFSTKNRKGVAKGAFNLVIGDEYFGTVTKSRIRTKLTKTTTDTGCGGGGGGGGGGECSSATDTLSLNASHFEGSEGTSFTATKNTDTGVVSVSAFFFEDSEATAPASTAHLIFVNGLAASTLTAASDLSTATLEVPADTPFLQGGLEYAAQGDPTETSVACGQQELGFGDLTQNVQLLFDSVGTKTVGAGDFGTLTRFTKSQGGQGHAASTEEVRRVPPRTTTKQKAKRPKVLLLDGYSLAFRAFFALPEDLATTDGTHTNAAYGFTAMLIKMLQEHRPDYIACCLDMGAPLERTETYAEYKSNRSTAPDTFKSQMPLIREVLTVLGIPIFELPGHEADDIIAFLARSTCEEGVDVRIVTGDRDFFQIVDDRIHVLYNRRGITDIVEADPKWIEEKYGVPPTKYLDLKALDGDPSDNLPGVPGVGTKTAAKLVQKYGSAEEAVAHADEQTPKLAQNLAAHAEQVAINKQVARLVEVPLEDVTLDDLKMAAWDMDKVRELFTSLEFKTLLERLMADLPEAAEGEGTPFELEVRVAATKAELEEVVGAIRTAGACALDVTPAMNPRHAPRSLSLAWDGGTAYVPLRTAEIAPLAGLLEDDSIPKVVHSARLATLGLWAAGIHLRGIHLDTHVGAYLLDPGATGYALEEVARKYTGRELKAVGSEERDESLAQGSLDLGGPEQDDIDAEVASLRALAVRELADAIEPELERLGMLELYRTVEHPLVEVLARMEEIGVKIDLDYLSDIGATLEKRIAELETECYELAGERINLGSPPQLRVLLYDKLGLKTTRRTKTGLSTDARALQQLVGQHPFVEKLLEYRELSKLKNTYIDALPPLVEDDGRIHTTYDQTVASTGRLSSTNPNLMNIPIRTELGKQIRRAFIPEPDQLLLSADYSQIELRVMAHLSEDPILLEVFERGEDVHSATACRIFGVQPDDITTYQRSAAKMVNYGLSYGMGAPGLADRLNVPRDEAEEIMDAYYEQFEGVAGFLDRIVKQAHADGFTTTMFGRRRYLPELGSGNPRVRAIGERQALNAPIQGTAADIMKLAMIRVDERLAAEDVETRMILTVHDELVFEVPTDEKDAATVIVEEAMTGVCEMKVPLAVDVSFGANWAEAKG